jgi:SAM-dependent methyltransferase
MAPDVRHVGVQHCIGASNQSRWHLTLCNDGRMASLSMFDRLLDEGNAEPVEGWDFSWFRGRATEARPSWKYFEGLSERIDRASAVLEVQTGGGERFAEILKGVTNKPKTLAATESWPPNTEIARSELEPLGVSVREVPDTTTFPFEDEAFDLVCSRHPTVTQWTEIARVLQSGGIYFSQQVGAGTNSELTDFIMGPQPISRRQTAGQAISSAWRAGLEVTDAQEESLPIEFFDVGAVVYFLRKVMWTVPDFTVDKYRSRLKSMHDHIERYGSFQSHSQRFLVEAMKPK